MEESTTNTTEHLPSQEITLLTKIIAKALLLQTLVDAPLEQLEDLLNQTVPTMLPF